MEFKFNKPVEFKRTRSFEHPLGDRMSPTDNLPSRLQSLTFGDYFNQSVNNLPCGLQSLTFGNDFNQPVEFKRTRSFEHPLGDILSPTDNLPSRLKNLTFGRDFNQSIKHLPSGLKSLTISKNYRKPLDKLPVSVEIIRYWKCLLKKKIK